MLHVTGILFVGIFIFIALFFFTSISPVAEAQTTPPQRPKEGQQALEAFLGGAGFTYQKSTCVYITKNGLRLKEEDAKKAIAKGEEGLTQQCYLQPDIRQLIVNILRMVLSVVGFLFFALIFYAGYLWMSAGGNEETIKKAKQLVNRAVIGFIIILAAYSITTFIGNYIRGSIAPPQGQGFTSEGQPFMRPLSPNP